MKTPMFIGSNFAILENGKEKIFQSYESVIAYVDASGKIYVDDDTTGTNLKQGTLFTHTTCKQFKAFMTDEMNMKPKAKETVFKWLARLEKEGKIVRVNLNA